MASEPAARQEASDIARSDFKHLFVHLPHYRIVVCRECRTAVPPCNVRDHLIRFHHDLSSARGNDLSNYVQTLPDVARILEEVVFPRQPSPVLSWFPVYDGACRCQIPVPNQHQRDDGTGAVCGKLLENEREFFRHCYREHPNVPYEGHIHETVKCQRFFDWKPWSRWFVVRTDQPKSREAIVNDRMAHFKEQYEKEKAESARASVRSMTMLRSHDGSWLRCTGWEEHLKGLTVVKLAYLILPAAEEPAGRRPWPTDKYAVAAAELLDEEIDRGLHIACACLRTTIRRAFALCKGGVICASLCEYINRHEAGPCGDETARPFYTGKDARTLRRYTDTWLKLLRYLWRTYDRHDELAPRYCMSSSQSLFLRSLQDASRKMAQRPSAHRRHGLERLMLSFWITMLRHPLAQGPHDSGIISGLAVIGAEAIRPLWTPPHCFAPSLSAVVNVARALVLYDSWWQRQVDLVVCGHLYKRSVADLGPNLYDLVVRCVQSCMPLSSSAHALHTTPMDELFHLRSRAKEIICDEYNCSLVDMLPRDGGADEKITIDWTSFTIGGLRSFVHGLEADVRASLMGLLLVSGAEARAGAAAIFDETRPPARSGSADDLISAFARQNPAQLPEVDISRLKDRPDETSTGWSFLDCESNRGALCAGASWLMDRLTRGEPSLRGRFIRRVDYDGTDSRSTTVIWNEQAVQAWLADLARFKEKLFVLVHLTAGLPGIGSELLGARYRNGPDGRSLRGIFIDKGLVSFRTEHHQLYRGTLRAQSIHRVVPRPVSEIIVYFLWLAVPFSRQLIRCIDADGPARGSDHVWQPDDVLPGADDDEYFIDEETFVDDKHHVEHQYFIESDDEEATGEDEALSDVEEPPDGARDTHQDRESLQAALQSCRRPGADEEMNTDGYWTMSRAAKVLICHTRRSIGRITLAQWRQVCLSLHSRSMSESRSDRSVKELLRFIHTKREPSVPVGHRWTAQDFRELNTDWHRYLGYPWHAACRARGDDMREPLGHGVAEMVDSKERPSCSAVKQEALDDGTSRAMQQSDYSTVKQETRVDRTSPTMQRIRHSAVKQETLVDGTSPAVQQPSCSAVEQESLYDDTSPARQQIRRSVKQETLDDDSNSALPWPAVAKALDSNHQTCLGGTSARSQRSNVFTSFHGPKAEVAVSAAPCAISPVDGHRKRRATTLEPLLDAVDVAGSARERKKRR